MPKQPEYTKSSPELYAIREKTLILLRLRFRIEQATVDCIDNLAEYVYLAGRQKGIEDAKAVINS